MFQRPHDLVCVCGWVWGVNFTFSCVGSQWNDPKERKSLPQDFLLTQQCLVEVFQSIHILSWMILWCRCALQRKTFKPWESHSLLTGNYNSKKIVRKQWICCYYYYSIWILVIYFYIYSGRKHWVPHYTYKLWHFVLLPKSRFFRILQLASYEIQQMFDVGQTLTHMPA
jgi:hypothetical protein